MTVRGAGRRRRPRLRSRATPPARTLSATVLAVGVAVVSIGPLAVAPRGLDASVQAPLARSTPAGSAPRAEPLLPAYARVPPEDSARVFRNLLEAMKRSLRGPYLRIRWFCADGSVHPPRPYACRERGGGFQHGQLSGEARRLEEAGYHVGGLLAATSYPEFLDRENDHHRLRELVLQDYLRRVDEGWVWREARSYRGSRQAEDEEEVGRRFLERLLADTTWVRRHFLLATDLVAAVPHGAGEGTVTTIRSLASQVAERDAGFRPVRDKIHTSPDRRDLRLVRDYLDRERPTDSTVRGRLERLRAVLEDHYEGGPVVRLAKLARRPAFRADGWPGGLASLRAALEAEAVGMAAPARSGPGTTRSGIGSGGGAYELPGRLAALAVRLREEAEAGTDGRDNLARLELLLLLEDLLLREAREALRTMGRAAGLDAAAAPGFGEDPAPPPTPMLEHVPPRRLLDLAAVLLDGVHARGLLSRREREAQRAVLEELKGRSSLPARQFQGEVSYLQRTVGWAEGSVARSYGLLLDRYAAVEPVARGFPADHLRGTPLLPLSQILDALGRRAARASGVSHSLFGHEVGGGFRGLNPGLAVGRLEVVTSEEIEGGALRSDRIYVLPHTLVDLPPVRGVLTLSEGSSLSHLQLLARNLGIPNAVIPASALPALRQRARDSVLYAVSPGGRVVLEDAREADPRLTRMVAALGSESDRRLSIDASALRPEVRRIFTLDELDPAEGGHTVGSKAAGLATLYRHFPERVTPALVLPFGYFRAHLDRLRSVDGTPLRDRLRAFHREMERADRAGRPLPDSLVRARLATFRQEILFAPVDPALAADLRRRLAAWGEPGSYGVFVRSDTNVEDLPGFGGAGLNLTVPNVRTFDGVLEAIRRVWASPFEPRAHAWRRAALDNPEHLHVSVVLQRAVSSETSGVLVTTGLASGDPDAITVTASEGVGGVVAGEAAESLELAPRGEVRLLAGYRAALRKELETRGVGGLVWRPTSGRERVLGERELGRLEAVVGRLERTVAPARGPDGRPLPWDLEFGFVGDRLWLFQLRPLAADPGGRTGGLEFLDRTREEEGGGRVELHPVVEAPT